MRVNPTFRSRLSSRRERSRNWLTIRLSRPPKSTSGWWWPSSWERVERLKNEPDWVDYSAISPIVVGMLGGDGIGPSISAETQTVLEHLLRGEVDSGKLEFRVIDGLTIENRAEQMQSIPDDVLAEIKDCHVTLKGPTHTPEQGDGWPNLESANVAMRKELDLFANIRPVRIPADGIDWTFFRENTEDMYAVGNQGINVTEDLGIDFRVITSQGSRQDHRRGICTRSEDRTRASDYCHKGQHRQDHGRQVPGHRSRGLGELPGHRVGRLVHRHHDGRADKSGASERLPGACSAEPLRRHPHR